MAKSILQNKKECYVTHSTQGLHLHHIYGGHGRRTRSDDHGFVVWLRADWHKDANYAVHNNNKALDLHLKQECQRKFEETHTREEFIAIVGRNYLD